MARLPNVGGDSGNWGNVLNDFLLVEHNPDGTLQADGSLATKADESHTHPQSDVTGLTAALDDKLDQATADTLYAAKAAWVPIVTRRTSGNLSVASTTWADMDPTGSAAARNLDIVIPGVSAGQWVELGLNAITSNQASSINLTYFSVVSGVSVNNISGADQGVPSWNGAASGFNTPAGSFMYQVQSGDIESGNARFRLTYRTNNLTAKGIFSSNTAGVANWALTCWGRGPFG